MWRIFGALVVVALLLAGGALVFREALLNLWLRDQLAAKLSDLLGADIRLHEVAWKDGILRAGKMRISGGELPFASCDAAAVNVPVEWNNFFDPGTVALTAEIGALDLVWHTPEKTANARAHEVPPLVMSVARFSFRHIGNPAWSLREAPLTASHRDGTWSFAAQAGELIMPDGTTMKVERASAKHAGHIFQIEDFAVRDPAGGTISGHAGHTAGAMWTGQFQWQNIDLASLPGWRWGDRLSGQTEGKATLENGILRGQMTISGAQTKGVPQLMKLAGLLSGENWQVVPWETLRFDFVRDTAGRVEFSNLEATSSRGLAVRGSGYYAPDSIGADLQIGVQERGRPWLAALKPLLFSKGDQGYLWTSVKVGGTPSAPTEDLTTRLVAALAVAPVEGAVETATDLPGAAVEAAGGLIKGLLGN